MCQRAKYDKIIVLNEEMRERIWNRPRAPGMKTTRYFEEHVLRKRPYLRREWCQKL
jgi:hypothetical protein